MSLETLRLASSSTLRNTSQDFIKVMVNQLRGKYCVSATKIKDSTCLQINKIVLINIERSFDIFSFKMHDNIIISLVLLLVRQSTSVRVLVRVL